MASQDWFEKDFYKTLGVSPEADEAEIKKAYRRMARENHPDQHPGDDAAEQRFKEIGEAYQVLSDAEDRKQYDAIRQMAAGGARFTAGGGGGGAGAAGFEDVFSSMFGGGGQRVRYSSGGAGGQQVGAEDLEDILRMFGGAGGGSQFAGADPFGRASRQAPQKGEPAEASVTVDLRQALEGDRATVRDAQGRTTTIRIPAGVKDGQRIRLRGKGHESPNGGEAGDLMITVHVRRHPVFTREGDDLLVELPVRFTEAALGATVTVPTPTGETVRVKVAPGTPSGRRLRIRGRGMPRKGGAGDLLAVVQVVVPTEPTGAEREAIEALQAAQGEDDPRAELIARASRS